MAPPALKGLREQLYRERERGSSIWVPELENREMEKLPLDAAEAACLAEIRSCQGFVCVLDGSYGMDQWDITEISILEAEIFLATLSRLPMAFFLLVPFTPDPRIVQLLDIVKAACPGIVIPEPRPKGDVVSGVLRFCEDLGSPWRRAQRRMVEIFARLRSPAFRPGTSEVLFLEGSFPPPRWGRFDGDLVETLAARAEGKERTHEKLVDLWKAVRSLAAVPYRDHRFRQHLPLWERILGQWASASSWYGLHGHFFLGRLAAVNTLLDIRSSGSPSGNDPYAIQGTYGALASEYVSIARQTSWWVRRRLLRRGLKLVDLALDTAQADSSGLLNIRGRLHIGLWRPDEAMRDYQRALDIRRDRGDGPAALGECEVDLGLACLLAGRLRSAERLLESGVERLRSVKPSGFTVRALRKLSLFYRATLRFRKSRETLAEAWQIAAALDLQDQMDQIRKEAQNG